MLCGVSKNTAIPSQSPTYRTLNLIILPEASTSTKCDASVRPFFGANPPAMFFVLLPSKPPCMHQSDPYVMSERQSSRNTTPSHHAAPSPSTGATCACGPYLRPPRSVRMDRYHPRILSFLATVAEIGGLLKKNDVSAARELIVDKQFDIRARRALSIYATSFSDNYVTETSRIFAKLHR